MSLYEVLYSYPFGLSIEGGNSGSKIHVKRGSSMVLWCAIQDWLETHSTILSIFLLFLYIKHWWLLDPGRWGWSPPACSLYFSAISKRFPRITRSDRFSVCPCKDQLHYPYCEALVYFQTMLRLQHHTTGVVVHALSWFWIRVNLVCFWIKRWT